MPGLFDGAFRRGGLLADLGASESDSVPTTAEMRVPPMRSPAHDLASLAWRGLQALAPNITNPATYAPLPPPAMTPTPEGKLPSLDRDPRVEGVMNDLVNIALTLAPLPGAGAGMGVARGVQGLMRRVTPIGAREAEALANKSAGLYNPPRKAAPAARGRLPSWSNRRCSRTTQPRHRRTTAHCKKSCGAPHGWRNGRSRPANGI
jgi:hypothetical protein